MKKKVAAVATPAPVEVAKPKVAPKHAVKLAVPAIPVTANRAQRRKAPAAVPVATVEPKFYPVKKTATASLTGSLSAIQQARSVLMNSRGFGEAIDTLNRLEAQAREQLVTAVNAEMKDRRVKTDGFNIGTESKPDGVHIVLTKQ